VSSAGHGFLARRSGTARSNAKELSLNVNTT
jgi:hypothetical protein